MDFVIADKDLPFSQYISQTRHLIQQRRAGLHSSNLNLAQILEANSPYELTPSRPLLNGKKFKYGVLLIHGLLDCPFSLRDIGLHLQAQGILSRAILLPGHGTTPNDLLTISYQEWIKAVRYGVESLRNEVENIYLIGYSTGAALSVYQALQDQHISGIILLAPAIKIKVPVDIVIGWHAFKKMFHHNGEQKQWVYYRDEIDYSKYISISFNAVKQVTDLTQIIKELTNQHSLTTPIFMSVSRDDETISSQSAVKFFQQCKNNKSKLLLYATQQRTYADTRIETRLAVNQKLHINHLSHIAMPFSPNNTHYGQHGDYSFASHLNEKNTEFGAYNPIEVDFFNKLYKLKLIKHKRRELTYNPDFYYLANKISDFILTTNK